MPHLPGGATVLPSKQRYSAPTYENRIRVINGRAAEGGKMPALVVVVVVVAAGWR